LVNERVISKELFAPPAYAHAVRSGSIVHSAGAVPLDADGHLVGAGDRIAQMSRVLANLETQLAAAGASPADVVKTVVYVVADEPADLSEVWELVRVSPFAGAASTLVGVSVLGYTGQLVEVEAVAVIG
jgi:enamine deaminase RidA (YjgF/YER057c/UK114 family)